MQLMAVRKKVIRAAAVTPEGASVLKRVADQYGMKEYVVAGKLFDWFGQQDDVFQRAVLGLLKGLEVEAAREFMRRLGAGGGTGTKPESSSGTKPLELVGHGVFVEGDRIEQMNTPTLGGPKPTRPVGKPSRPK